MLIACLRSIQVAYCVFALSAHFQTFWGVHTAPLYNRSMNWAILGAALLAAAVIMGAFGAHALRKRLDAYAISIYEKAVFYHFVHALGILIVALLAQTQVIPIASLALIGWLLFLGIILFSGSLYALAISGVRVLGAVTPLGGLLFIAGWIVLAVEAGKVQRLWA